MLLPKISTSLEPSKMPPTLKHLGVMKRLLKKWLQVQNSNSYKKGTDALGSHWRKAVEVRDYAEKRSV
jgi:hypothetical protein